MSDSQDDEDGENLVVTPTRKDFVAAYLVHDKFQSDTRPVVYTSDGYICACHQDGRCSHIRAVREYTLNHLGTDGRGDLQFPSPQEHGIETA